MLFQAPECLQAQAKTFFDPTTDPVLTTEGNKTVFAVPEETLIRSVDIRVGKLGGVESVGKEKIEEHWYLTIYCRHEQDIEQSIMVALKLKSDGMGNYFADHSWVACIGTPCGACGWDPESGLCFCKTDRPGEPGVEGECVQVWSDEFLLRKVVIKP